MRTNTIAILFLLVVGCAEQPITMTYDAGPSDAWMEQADGAVGADAGVDAVVDAMVERDAGPVGSDAGSGDAGVGRDAAPDAAPPADADAGVADAGSDAGVDAAPSPDAAAPVDAGPPRPVGAAVDVTGSRCALDSAGSVWCWGRWTPVEDVRLMGTGFDSVSGSCALRGHEVWCAEFTTETMIPVIEGSATLEVNSVAEYSDLARGCGMRLTPEGWGEAVCWTDGGSVAREGGTGAEIVAVSATSPREVLSTTGYTLLDLNPPATCHVGSIGGASCARDTGGTYGIPRPSGDHLVLGFGMLCAHSAGATTCATGASPVAIADVGGFNDQAVAWPVGDVGAPGTMPFEARGVCISGSSLRCYDSSGTLAYTVNW